MTKRARTPLPPNKGEPVVPSDVYQVLVYRLTPDQTQPWIRVLDLKTTAQSPLGAMQGIVAAETAKEMLALQKAVDGKD